MSDVHLLTNADLPADLSRFNVVEGDLIATRPISYTRNNLGEQDPPNRLYMAVHSEKHDGLIAAEIDWPVARYLLSAQRVDDLAAKLFGAKLL